MSQKSSRRVRRQTNDDDPTFKAPTPSPKPNGTEESPPISEQKEPTPSPQLDETPSEKETPQEKEVPENDTGAAVTRSRSATPQVKKLTNGHEEEEKNEDVDVPPKEQEIEMDPLIVSDEPDPELVFEENSDDLESGQESPVLSRCKTRRSQTRNIPTPKTPKLLEEETPAQEVIVEEKEEEEEEEAQKEELNVTFESCSENVSTKVQVGGDSTRLDYMDKDVSNLESNSFLQGAKNKSFGETLRRLSTRRTIRPISYEYGKRLLLQKNAERANISATYPIRNSVERISAVGLKRKSVSDGEEDCGKRFKSGSPGFFAKFTSPLVSIKNTFRSDLPSSTPKLTGYKDDNYMLEDDGVISKMCEVRDGERRWCSIM